MGKYYIYVFCLLSLVWGCKSKEPISSSGIENADSGMESIGLVRDNYKRINAIPKWTHIKSKDLDGSEEGGEAKFYFLGDELKMITAVFYGETFNTAAEYYFLNKQLSLVIERSEQYDRPIYYDSTAMKENMDTTVFGPDKSEIAIDTSFFINGQIVALHNNQDCGAPFDPAYLKQEEKRIKADFDQLVNSVH